MFALNLFIIIIIGVLAPQLTHHFSHFTINKFDNLCVHILLEMIEF